MNRYSIIFGLIGVALIVAGFGVIYYGSTHLHVSQRIVAVMIGALGTCLAAGGIILAVVAWMGRKY